MYFIGEKLRHGNIAAQLITLPYIAKAARRVSLLKFPMMKQPYFLSLLATLMLLSCTDDRDIETEPVVVDPEAVLVHYWNFNNVSGTVTEINADFSLVDGAQITYPGSGAGYMDDFDPGYAMNARNNDEPGAGFRARNPSDTRSLVIALPTTGYKNVLVRFATSRTGSGATTQIYSYTVDGINYISDGLATNTHNPIQEPSSSLVSLDFTGIAGVDDNADFKLKINFGGETVAGDSGNNRFDNLTLEGVPINGGGSGPGPIDDTVHLFHYWNFNSVSGTVTSIAPDATLVSGSGAAITYDGTGAGYMDSFAPGSVENARNNDEAGNGIRMRNPSNTRSFRITASTAGYKDIVVKFATAKSSASGASLQNYSYSLDGVNFITAGMPVTTYSADVDPAYNIVTLDFSTIAGANNNPSFAVKIDFSGPEASGASGNNRFDNLTFEGKQL